LYRALAIGTMSIVAPITAVCAAAVPVVVAVVLGERPGPVAVLGIALAALAIVLLSLSDRSDPAERREGSGRSAAGLAFIAGVAVGLFFLCLAQTSSTAGMWPLIVGRSVSVPLFGALAATTGRQVEMTFAVARTAAACGTLDMLANALFLVATRYGPLSLVATLASLYPASTVILAWLTLGERLARLQALGVMCALTAVVLIVGSG
jgi:drug/metabolite transporter (DMT)-like permease